MLAAVVPVPELQEDVQGLPVAGLGLGRTAADPGRPCRAGGRWRAWRSCRRCCMELKSRPVVAPGVVGRCCWSAATPARLCSRASSRCCGFAGGLGVAGDGVVEQFPPRGLLLAWSRYSSSGPIRLADGLAGLESPGEGGGQVGVLGPGDGLPGGPRPGISRRESAAGAGRRRCRCRAGSGPGRWRPAGWAGRAGGCAGSTGRTGCTCT